MCGGRSNPAPLFGKGYGTRVGGVIIGAAQTVGGTAHTLALGDQFGHWAAANIAFADKNKAPNRLEINIRQPIIMAEIPQQLVLGKAHQALWSRNCFDSSAKSSHHGLPQSLAAEGKVYKYASSV